ncbi:MAG: DJ-1/PfpI family protein [Muribaculaceae bacterium]|nr:DJ-1/PfpI family protein [Muribaculaceae bacterium]
MSTTYVFLAPGFEEIEAIAPVDLMRRAGIDVMTVAVGESRHVTGAHGITVEADLLLGDEDMSDADLLVAPGGMPGAKNLADSDKLCALFKAQAARGALVAAICAAPAVLLSHIGVLKGKNATCYPGFDDDLRAGGATYVSDERVVRDDNIITANGPSSAIPFGLALVEALRPRHSREVAAGILL